MVMGQSKTFPFTVSTTLNKYIPKTKITEESKNSDI